MKKQTPLLESFESFIRQHDLFREGEKILLAVSGGMDSTVMLDLFLRIRQPWDLILSIAHLNHGLRGTAADDDAAFVKHLAGKHHLPFHLKKVDVKAFAVENKLSIEEAARELRLDYLNAILKETGYDHLALGHHANDQAETVLMNLVRGSGIRGLGGMRPRRDRIIRPLLFATRKSLESYAQARDLPFADDASNRDRQFLRNRFRLDVIPVLEKALGRPAVSTICRTSDSCREVEDYLTFQAMRAVDAVVVSRSPYEIILDIDKFLSYFKAIQKVVLFQLFEEVFDREEIGSHKLQRILDLAQHGRKGGRVELACGGQILKTDEGLVLVKKRPSVPERTIHVGENVSIPELSIRFRFKIFKRSEKKIAFSPEGTVEYFDYDKLSFPLRLRGIRVGDRFFPLGMENKKKVHDFLVDRKIPFHRRPPIPLLVSGDDIVWVVGHRIDEQYKVTSETVNVLRVEMIHQQKPS